MGYAFRTEEQQGAVDGLRRFLDAKVEPVVNKEYRDKFIPREKMGAIMRELTQFGLVSGVISEANGGTEIDWLTMTMLFEEVATTSADLSVPVLINSFGAYMVEQLAPAHLRERYLRHEFPKAEYSARVDALRRQYPVLALRARDWVLP